MNTFKTATAKAEAFATALQAKGYRTYVQEKDENVLFGYCNAANKNSRHVWHWVDICIDNGYVFFYETYSANTGKSNKGVKQGLNIREALEKKIGSELYRAEVVHVSIDGASIEEMTEAYNTALGFKTSLTGQQLIIQYNHFVEKGKIARKNSDDFAEASEPLQETAQEVATAVVTDVKTAKASVITFKIRNTDGPAEVAQGTLYHIGGRPFVFHKIMAGTAEMWKITDFATGVGIMDGFYKGIITEEQFITKVEKFLLENGQVRLDKVVRYEERVGILNTMPEDFGDILNGTTDEFKRELLKHLQGLNL